MMMFSISIITLILLHQCAASYYASPNLRRQDVGYTTNIFHPDPNQPDQMAQSSVNVNFNPSPQNAVHHNVKNRIPSHSQSQLFNVGYSVSFKNTPQQYKPKQFKTKKINLDEGEIITGTRKQNEQVAIPNMTPQEFVSQALLDKKHKISGIKPKAKSPVNFGKLPNHQQLLTKANLSPTTQKYLKALDNQKPFANQQLAIKQHQQNYAWRNLSPSVEIVRSSEIPLGHKFAAKFNHASALGRSESFGFNNLMERNVAAASDNQIFATESQPASNIPPISSHLAQHEDVRTADLPQIQVDLPVNHQPEPAPPPSDFRASEPIAVDVPQLQQPNIPNGVPKLPIDTRLLRDPVITTDFKDVPDNPNLIPIHFDIRPIQEAMKNQLLQANYQQQPIQYAPFEQQYQQSQFYFPQNNQLQQQQPAVFYQNEQPIVENYQNEYQQNAGFKIYGKPQPMKMNYNNEVYPHNQRQPRFNSAEETLHTNLRPPPIAPAGHIRYQRRAAGARNVYSH